MGTLIIFNCLYYYLCVGIVFSNVNFSHLKLKGLFLLIFKTSGNSNLKRPVINTFSKIISSWIIKLHSPNQWKLVTMKNEKHSIDRITKFLVHNFFKTNLLLWGNNDRKPMLRITPSRDLFHLIYVFVKFL